MRRRPTRSTIGSTEQDGGDRLQYLDANVFLFAVLDEGDRGDSARGLLRSVVEGEARAATSALTIDEVVWILQGEGPREVAIQECQRLIGLPNLEMLDVTAEDALDALSRMEEDQGLGPRDAIHAAVAANHGIYTIVSDDPDLDQLPDVDREPLATEDD